MITVAQKRKKITAVLFYSTHEVIHYLKVDCDALKMHI